VSVLNAVSVAVLATLGAIASSAASAQTTSTEPRSAQRVALDRQGTVILGDPAVALPLKGSAGGI
jgi:hypothetical protein